MATADITGNITTDAHVIKLSYVFALPVTDEAALLDIAAERLRADLAKALREARK